MQWCEELDLPYQTINARYKRDSNIIPERLFRPIGSNRNNRGSNNHKSKINEEQAKEIKKRLLNNETAVNIAKDYNVSKSLIYDIKRGKTWSHI